MKDSFNDKNNKATRLEMIAAIYYLLENCDEPNKASEGLAFVEYAQKRFGIYVDRRRANPLFMHLYEMSNDLCKISDLNFPFLVKMKKLKQGARFYIEKRVFGDVDLNIILRSIKKNGNILGPQESALINKVLDVACTKTSKNETLEKLKYYDVKKGSATRQENDLLQTLYYYADEAYIIHFELIDVLKIKKSYGDKKDYKSELYGQVIKIIEEPNKTPKVAIYCYGLKNKAVIVTPVDNVKITKQADTVFKIKELHEIDGTEFKTAEEWLDKFFKGQTGEQYKIKFKFYVGENNCNLEKVEKAYMKWFKKDNMPYHLEDREVKIITRDENNKFIEKTVIAKDCVSEIEASLDSFKSWYFDNGFFQWMVILEPKRWNNRFLLTLTRRFARRINKYGEGLKLRMELETDREYMERHKTRTSSTPSEAVDTNK